MTLEEVYKFLKEWLKVWQKRKTVTKENLTKLQHIVNEYESAIITIAKEREKQNAEKQNANASKKDNNSKGSSWWRNNRNR
jgi:hypothetical protein